MPSRALQAALGTAGLLLVLAEPAMAESDNGEGLVGETDDKIVTAFGLGLVVFFILVAILGTVFQSRLEKRKEEKKAAALRQRTGW